jgi:hypothetical protein
MRWNLDSAMRMGDKEEVSRSETIWLLFLLIPAGLFRPAQIM